MREGNDLEKPITVRLREHTREHHERAEKAVDLTAHCASLAAYRSLLERLLGLYTPLEEIQALLDWEQAGLAFEPRRKAFLLRADLAALGAGPAKLGALPACDRLPRPATLAAGIGCQYVLEGATLGGQIVARELRGSLGLDPDHGARFYAGYGAETGRMWREFCSAADEYCGKDPQRHEDALTAAAETFEAFESWLLKGGKTLP